MHQFDQGRLQKKRIPLPQENFSVLSRIYNERVILANRFKHKVIERDNSKL